MGIKGVGMAGLALIAKQMGKHVQGSDAEEVFITDEILAKHGIQPLPGFDKERVNGVDLVIATGAHGGKTNVESQAALEQGIPVLMHAEAVALFAREKKMIAIAGCHGKTSTTAMLALILEKNGLDPAYLIGTSTVPGLPAAAKWGSGEFFLVEADEYVTDPQTDTTPRFHHYRPHISVVNNIEWDHPDVYDSLQAVEASFRTFVQQTKKLAILSVDSEPVVEMLGQGEWKSQLRTFGIQEAADQRITDFRSIAGKTEWQLDGDEYRLPIPGLHNVQNASAAILVAKEIGLTPDQIAEALAQFAGSKRRFEFKGRFRQALIYDDYAHHPTEVRATLQAARGWFQHQRILALFQPHTYSRTKALFGDFASAFTEADIVLITPIFASAREEADPAVSAHKLAEQIRSQTKAQVHYFPSLEHVEEWLSGCLGTDDVLLTMGAGNVYRVGERLINE